MLDFNWKYTTKSENVQGIPALLNFKGAYLFGGVGKCLLPNGMVVQMTYDQKECCLYGLRNYFEEVGIEVDDVLVITKSGNSEWFLDIMKKNRIGFMKSVICTTEISDRMKTNRYHLRSRKRSFITADLEALTGVDETEGTYLVLEHKVNLD